MTNEGSLISFAADNDKDATVYSAISANIWNTYKKASVDTSLQYQIITCQVKKLPIVHFKAYTNYRMVLCLLRVLEPCYYVWWVMPK